MINFAGETVSDSEQLLNLMAEMAEVEKRLMAIHARGKQIETRAQACSVRKKLYKGNKADFDARSKKLNEQMQFFVQCCRFTDKHNDMVASYANVDPNVIPDSISSLMLENAKKIDVMRASPEYVQRPSTADLQQRTKMRAELKVEREKICEQSKLVKADREMQEVDKNKILTEKAELAAKITSLTQKNSLVNRQLLVSDDSEEGSVDNNPRCTNTSSSIQELSFGIRKNVAPTISRDIRKVKMGSSDSDTRLQDKNDGALFLPNNTKDALLKSKAKSGKDAAEISLSGIQKIAEYTDGIGIISAELHAGAAEEGVSIAGKATVNIDDSASVVASSQLQADSKSMAVSADAALGSLQVAGQTLDAQTLSLGDRDGGFSVGVSLPKAKAAAKISATEGVNLSAQASVAEVDVTHTTDKRCIDGSSYVVALTGFVGAGAAAGIKLDKSSEEKTPAELYSAEVKAGGIIYPGIRAKVKHVPEDPACTGKDFLEKASLVLKK